MTEDPYARIRPQRPATTPTSRTYGTATTLLVLSLLFAPLAVVSLILGSQLSQRGDHRGTPIMVASVLVLAIAAVLVYNYAG